MEGLLFVQCALSLLCIQRVCACVRVCVRACMCKTFFHSECFQTINSLLITVKHTFLRYTLKKSEELLVSPAAGRLLLLFLRNQINKTHNTPICAERFLVVWDHTKLKQCRSTKESRTVEKG